MPIVSEKKFLVAVNIRMGEQRGDGIIGYPTGELTVERHLHVDSLDLDEMFRIVRMFDNLALILKNPACADEAENVLRTLARQA